MIIGLGHKIKSGKDTVANMIRFLVEYNRITLEENYTSEQTLWQEYLNFCRVDDLKYNFEVKRFADKIKEIVCILIGCTLEQLEDHNFKNAELGKEWWLYKALVPSGTANKLIVVPEIFNTTEEAWEKITDLGYGKAVSGVKCVKLTPRLLFNLIGTESGRKIIHPNIWVNALFSKYYATLYLNDDIYPELNNCVGVTKYPNPFDHPKLYPNWIITDVRFPNEASAIKSKAGIVVKVQRDFCFDTLEDYLVTYPDKNISKKAAQLVSEFKGTYPELLEHFAKMFPEETKQFLSESHKLESETALDNYEEWDYIIDNNGTQEELLVKVKEFLEHYKII